MINKKLVLIATLLFSATQVVSMQNISEMMKPEVIEIIEEPKKKKVIKKHRRVRSDKEPEVKTDCCLTREQIGSIIGSTLAIALVIAQIAQLLIKK